MATTRKNQMLGLMEIAWGYCKRDIYAVVHYYFGAMIAMLVFVCFSVLNFGVFTQAYPLDTSTGVLATALWYGIEWGYVNTICYLSLIAIIVCLLEYAGNFLIAAYHYDNESWFTVNTIRESIRSYWKWVRNNQDKQDSEYKDYREELHSKLISLKIEIE